MAVLSNELRNLLQRTVLRAREVAEAGVRATIEALAVPKAEPYPTMTQEQLHLRLRLRAHGRQLGDKRFTSGEQEIDLLLQESAYQHWHRMLFTRFLAENNLLIEPQTGVAITMAECDELAKEQGKDAWSLAGLYAQSMLPQVFRQDDPLLAMELPPETKQELERLVSELPEAVFQADDALGWTYQFWQTKNKDEINKSGVKIGANELPAVTQLFTEPYMVSFLLDNSLGAWWAAQRLPAEVLAKTYHYWRHIPKV